VPVTNWTTIAGMSALIDRYLAAVLPRIGSGLPMHGETRVLRAFQALWAAASKPRGPTCGSRSRHEVAGRVG
jgi:hypothetical protein